MLQKKNKELTLLNPFRENKTTSVRNKQVRSLGNRGHDAVHVYSH